MGKFRTITVTVAGFPINLCTLYVLLITATANISGEISEPVLSASQPLSPTHAVQHGEVWINNPHDRHGLWRGS